MSLNVEFCDDESLRRCIVLPQASLRPTVVQIYSGLTFNNINATFRSNLTRSANISVNGLNPDSRYVAYCAARNNDGDFIENEKVLFSTATEFHPRSRENYSTKSF